MLNIPILYDVVFSIVRRCLSWFRVARMDSHLDCPIIDRSVNFHVDLLANIDIKGIAWKRVPEVGVTIKGHVHPVVAGP